MGLFHSPRIVTSNLSLVLDSFNTKSYPGSGTAWNDISGNAFNGTLTNGPTFADRSIVFDGTNDLVAVSPTTQIGNIDFTIEFTVKVSVTSGNYGIFLWGGGPFNLNGKGVELRFQTNLLEYSINDGTGVGTRLQYNGIANIADGAWRHFTITQTKQGTATLYLNGTSVATQSYSAESLFTDTLSLQIGRGNDGYLNGSIQIFKVYSGLLTNNQVLQNYNAYRGRYGI